MTQTPPRPLALVDAPAPRPSPTRRGLLRGGVLAGAGAGAVALLGWRAPTADAALAAVTGCTTLTPEKTLGPFWVDERLQRSDLRPDSASGAVQGGIPLTFTLALTDAGGGCTAQAGAVVDVWHANAAGAYSDVSGAGNPDTRGQDWLRGYQVSDAAGQVTFTTVFPGWYVGRTFHLHLRVRLSLDSSTTLDFTSQLFFSEEVGAAVAASSGYARSGTRTTNATDDLYDASLVMPVSGSPGAGYTGAFTLDLDLGDGAAATTSTSSTGSSSTSTAVTTTGSRQVAASMLSGAVLRRSGRRVVRVRLTHDEAVTARLRLVRHDDVLARRQWGWLPARSRRTLVLPVPRSVPAGPARVTLLLADRAGHTRTEKVRVQVPAR